MGFQVSILKRTKKKKKRVTAACLIESWKYARILVFGFMSDFYKIQVCKLFFLNFFLSLLCKHTASPLNRMTNKDENKQSEHELQQMFKRKSKLNWEEITSLAQNGFC